MLPRTLAASGRRIAHRSARCPPGLILGRPPGLARATVVGGDVRAGRAGDLSSPWPGALADPFCPVSPARSSTDQPFVVLFGGFEFIFVVVVAVDGAARLVVVVGKRGELCRF